MKPTERKDSPVEVRGKVAEMVNDAMRQHRKLTLAIREYQPSDDELELRRALLSQFTSEDMKSVLKAIGRQRPISWQMACRMLTHLIAVTGRERTAGAPLSA